MNEIKLCLVGDVQIISPLDINSEVFKVLKDSDIVFCNIESPLSNKGQPSNKLITLRSNPDRVKDLKEINVSVASLANNHILDYGYEAMFDTLNLLDKAEIKHVGVGGNLEEALKPVVFNFNNISIGFLGCATTLPLDFAANKEKPGVAPIRVKTYYHIDPVIEQEQPGTPPSIYTEPVEEDLYTVLEFVEKTANQTDVVIASIHWGVPFQYEVMDYQLKIAERMIHVGVDIIVGHHPHVLHGVGKYGDGKYVFYSLGNFIFHYKPPSELIKKVPKVLKKLQMSPESAIVKVSINRGGIKEIEVVPVIINELGNPVFCSEKEADKIFSKLRELTEDLGTKVDIYRDSNGLIKVI